MFFKPVGALVRDVAVCAVALAAALALTALPASAQTNATEILSREPDQLVAILKAPDAPVFEKAKACQRLAVVGTREAVPVLAGLLGDETLNLYARFALEGIPDPAVDEALRKAAEKLQGRPLVGVLSSIGQRKDEQAVDLLRGLLGNSDPAVVAAAADALGQIGTSEAAGALKKALANDSAQKAPIADAALACAGNLAAAGDTAGAVALYESVAQADVPKHLRSDALGGKLRLLKGDAKDLLLEQIRSDDAEFFNLGLAVAREIPGSDVTAALAGELKKLPPDRQARLLEALGDRAEPPPLSTVVAATKSDSTQVREAALGVLARFNDAEAVAILLDAALSDGDVAASARERVKRLEGNAVDTAIVARLQSADGQAKVVLLDLAGARRITAAEPAAQSALADSDPAVQSAAIAALGQLVELDGLELLISRALASGDSPQTAAAKAALKTAALRMGDREGCAALLAANLQGAGAENQVYLLDVLGRVSGKTALETVVANAESDDPAIKDGATRILGEWVNPDAAPALLDIAQNDSEAKYRIRALRGYLRIARQLQLPEEARLEMFHTAMGVAQRDEEKQLAFDVLTRIPSLATLELALSHLQQPALKEAAAKAAVGIGKKLAGSEPQAVAQAMQKVAESGVEGNVGTDARQLLERVQAAAN